jgi:hypothetical protein
LEAGKAKEAIHAQDALKKMEEEQAAKKAEQVEAELKKKEKLKTLHEKRLKEQEDAYKQDEEAMAIQNVLKNSKCSSNVSKKPLHWMRKS